MQIVNSQSDDDKHLLQLLRKGDVNAFNHIYKEFGASLISFASSKLYSLEAARDVIQDLFETIWEKRETIEIKGSIKTFLYSAVRYRIIDNIRKNSSRAEYAAMLQNLSLDHLVNLQKQIEDRDLIKNINLTVEGLNPSIKKVYKLSRVENLTTAEIAMQLGLSEQTVKNQLSAALKALRTEYSKLISALIAVWMSM